MKKFTGLLTAVLALTLTVSCSDIIKESSASNKSTASNKSNLKFVDPFIGTGGHGHTYPGPTMPFGMVQLSPDNPTAGWDWSSGYHASDNTIVGFSHTHLSGTGVGDLLDILVLPFRGEYKDHQKDDRGRLFTAFSHDKESAEPGYYTVDLPEEQVKAELTVTQRTGIHRYTYQGDEAAKLFFDLGYNKNADHPVMTFFRIDNDKKISGYRFSTGWAKLQPIYFTAEFNQPFTYQLYKNGTPVKGHNLKDRLGQAELNFGNLNGKELIAKVGISYTGIEAADENLQTEVNDFDFDLVKTKAQEAWRQQLNTIDVIKGNEVDKKIFYSALYHSSLAPQTFSDVNGNFYGGDGAVHTAKGYDRYTLFSLWDTFRSLQPLLTITNPDRIDDMAKSMMGFYEETGLLPSWEFVGNETDVMIGYHAVPVLVDAYLKGLTDIDGHKLLEAVKTSAMQDKFGIDFYRDYEYIPSDLEVEAVSKTLEYAFNDWTIAQLAKELGEGEDYQLFTKRSQYYRNLYDHSTGFMRGKTSDGKWVTPFNPSLVEHRKNDYTEANAWQYTWFFLHDVPGFMEFMGGEEQFISQLDELFATQQKMEGDVSSDISGLIGQYVHGNEPCHHIAYLYFYTSQKKKGEDWIKTIRETMYKADIDGLAGNDDVGQMSSWYVMSALGFYPVNPASGEFVLGTPLFDEVSLPVADNKTLTIKKLGDGYVTSITLNGKKLDRTISYQQLMQGGELIFTLAP